MQAEKKQHSSLRQRAARLAWSFETFACLAFARFLTKFVPMRYWRHWLGEILPLESEGRVTDCDHDDLQKALIVGRWVNHMAARAPFSALCLQKAMAARWMLKRRNIPTQLFIGVRLDEVRDLEGHAWLMYGEHYLTGGEEREGFKTLRKSTSTQP